MAEKTVSVSYRVSPQFKQLLETAAANERRSQTNMLEKLVFEYCQVHGIEVPTSPEASTPLEYRP
ncbi:hypothetical protein [Cupriavidus sp. CuC1]|uniref:hypothetical protein n=1 Tax=Cupriavidus sp. CuC1 TaxID=3373131 RepID=UPI0037D74BA3